MSASNTRRTIRLTVCSDRNWFEFVSLLDGTFAEPESEDVQERVTKTRQFLESIKEKDGKADRSAHLAALELEKRATLPVPASKGSVTYKSAKSISGTFDGGMKTYGRGVKCTGQAEGGDADAVFILENGATLKNAIIGKDQIEGVHCKGACNIENVWWVDVCEGKLFLFRFS